MIDGWNFDNAAKKERELLMQKEKVGVSRSIDASGGYDHC